MAGKALKMWRAIGSVLIVITCLVFRIPVAVKDAQALYTWLAGAIGESTRVDGPIHAQILDSSGDSCIANIWVCVSGAEHNPVARAQYWQIRARRAEALLCQERATSPG